MGFAGFLAGIVGILLCVLSANGRLQPTIAAMFGQSQPGATPTGGWASDPGQAGPGSAGGWGPIIGGLLGSGGGGNSGGGFGFGGGSYGDPGPWGNPYGGGSGDGGGSGGGFGVGGGNYRGPTQSQNLRARMSRTFYQEV